MRRILIVYGTRPEAVKIAPLVSALSEHAFFEQIVVVTGQHRAMLDQVNRVFGIVPDHDLDIMQAGQSLSGVMERVLAGLTPLLERIRPDLVVVQGDTTTSTAAAIAAAYLGIPVAHVEAGLRSHDSTSPFPEEINRKITSQIARIHFAPTLESRTNLMREGIAARDVAVTGNTVIDALLGVVAAGRHPHPVVERARSTARHMILLTTHRRENLGAGMDSIAKAVRAIARDRPEDAVLFPAHLNPAVRATILPQLAGLPNVFVCEPLEYAPFVTAMESADLILTDSGGVQEEAPSLGKPVLVLRDTTERPEAVRAGVVRLVGTDADRIVAEVSRLLDDGKAYAAMAAAVNPYGDGRAAERIVSSFEAFFGIGDRRPDFEPAPQAMAPNAS